MESSGLGMCRTFQRSGQCKNPNCTYTHAPQPGAQHSYVNQAMTPARTPVSSMMNSAHNNGPSPQQTMSPHAFLPANLLNTPSPPHQNQRPGPTAGMMPPPQPFFMAQEGFNQPSQQQGSHNQGPPQQQQQQAQSQAQYHQQPQQPQRPQQHMLLMQQWITSQALGVFSGMYPQQQLCFPFLQSGTCPNPGGCMLFHPNYQQQQQLATQMMSLLAQGQQPQAVQQNQYQMPAQQQGAASWGPYPNAVPNQQASRDYDEQFPSFSMDHNQAGPGRLSSQSSTSTLVPDDRVPAHPNASDEGSTTAGSPSNKSDDSSGQTKKTRRRPSNQPCRQFLAGTCEFGEDCWFSHKTPSEIAAAAAERAAAAAAAAAQVKPKTKGGHKSGRRRPRNKTASIPTESSSSGDTMTSRPRGKLINHNAQQKAVMGR